MIMYGAGTIEVISSKITPENAKMARHTIRVWDAIINNMGDVEDIANVVVDLFIQSWNGHSLVDISFE